MLPWLVRLTWLALPFTAGTAIADALHPRSAAVQVTAAVLLWGGWAIVVLGVLVPRPAALVGLRVGALTAVALAVWAADSAVDWWVGVLHAVVTLVFALAPETGEWQVNGTSYGYERRYLLRPPAPLIAGPIALASLLLAAAVLCGPLLLAARAWVLGALAMAAGAVLAALLARALHSMTLRWAVLVPAGLVLKDHLALLDPVLFRRTDIELLHRAPADTDGLDCTADAPGLAVEIRLREKQRVDRMRPVRRGSEPFDAERLLFTPSRPGALLRDAASRRFRVGD